VILAADAQVNTRVRSASPAKKTTARDQSVLPDRANLWPVGGLSNRYGVCYGDHWESRCCRCTGSLLFMASMNGRSENCTGSLQESTSASASDSDERHVCHSVSDNAAVSP